MPHDASSVRARPHWSRGMDLKVFVVPLVQFQARNFCVSHDARKRRTQIGRRSGGDLRFFGRTRWRRDGFRCGEKSRGNQSVYSSIAREISLSRRNLGAFRRRWRCYANAWRTRSATKTLRQTAQRLTSFAARRNEGFV